MTWGREGPWPTRPISPPATRTHDSAGVVNSIPVGSSVAARRGGYRSHWGARRSSGSSRMRFCRRSRMSARGNREARRLHRRSAGCSPVEPSARNQASQCAHLELSETSPVRCQRPSVAQQIPNAVAASAAPAMAMKLELAMPPSEIWTIADAISAAYAGRSGIRA